MGFETISSLHDDLLTPKALGHLGEYDDYPRRFDVTEKSVIRRIEQFGVDIKEVEDVLEKKIHELTWSEYLSLVSEAIRAKYDVIVGSVFDRYAFPGTEDKSDWMRWDKMRELISLYEDAHVSFGVNLIRRKSDFGESGNLVLCLEAGAHLITDMSRLEMLDDYGVRIFGFQYGIDTPLATNRGGLTEFGIRALEYCFDRSLMVDLAHSSVKTRSDILDRAEDRGFGHLVSYTHGSTEKDMMESWKDKVGERALMEREVKRLVSIGGIVGLGVSEPFFDGAESVAKRIFETAQLDRGIDRVAIGTDFGGLSPDYLHDVRNPDDFNRISDILSERFGVDDDSIRKVLRKNVRDWIGSAMTLSGR